MIWWDMPAKYYEYLIRVDSYDKLVSYGDRARGFAHSQWVALLAGRDPEADLVALEDQHDEPPEEEEPGVAGPDPPGAPAPPRPAWEFHTARPIRFSPLECGSWPMVRMDNLSHPSGEARMWARCERVGHCSPPSRCEKWRFVKDFFSEKECAIWLAAWWLEGENAPCQLEHRGVDPSNENLQCASRHYIGM